MIEKNSKIALDWENHRESKNKPCTKPFLLRFSICDQFQNALNLSWHLLGITVVQRETEDNAYAKFLEGEQRRCIKDDVQINNFMSLRAYEARRKFVEHERGVTVVRGAVESN